MFYDCMNSSITISDMPMFILKHILHYVIENDTLVNLRITCKYLYKLLEIFTLYDMFGSPKKCIVFMNHDLIKIIQYSYRRDLSLYIDKILHYNNYKLCGYSYDYNADMWMVSKSCYHKNKLHGDTIVYNNNTIISKTQYKHGEKHGCEYLNRRIFTYIGDYNMGEIVTYQKKKFNNIVFEMLWNGTRCKVVVKSRFGGDNIINLKYGRCNESVIICQHDRKLNLLFNMGYLSGPQVVLSRDNELKFIGNYNIGNLYGKYKYFNKQKVSEEGQYDYSGNLLYCNVYSSIKTINYKFNTLQKLDGIYNENTILYNYTVGFNDGRFNGTYIESSFLCDSLTQVNIYNYNNFTIIKKLDCCSITLKKSLGHYTLTITFDTNNLYTPNISTNKYNFNKNTSFYLGFFQV